MFGVNLLLPLFTFARWAFLRTHSFRATLLDALPLRGFVFLFWFCSLLATRSLSSHLAPRVLLPCRLNIYILIDCQCVVWDSDLFWLIEELYFLTFLRYLVNSLTWTKQQLCDLVWNSHLWIFRFKGGWGGFPAKLQDVEFLIPPSLRSQPPKPSPGEPDWRTSRKQSKDDTPDNEFGKRVARFQLCMLSLQVKPLFLFWK